MPPKKKQGAAKAAAAATAAGQETVPLSAAAPASAPSPPSPPAAGPKVIKDEKIYEWATLKLKVVGLGLESHGDAEVTLPTSTTIHELRRLLEERHGWFLELAVALDAAPGHAGHTLLLDTRAAASLQPAPSSTLAECGVWGRRYRRRVDAEGVANPVVCFVYYAFTQGPDDPLLRFDAGP